MRRDKDDESDEEEEEKEEVEEEENEEEEEETITPRQLRGRRNVGTTSTSECGPATRPGRLMSLG